MKFISLRSKLIIAFIALILLPITGAFLYGYNAFESILKKQIEQSTSNLLHQVNLNLERELIAMMSASNAFVVDENIAYLLTHPPTTEKEKLLATHQMDKKYLEISTAIINNPTYFSLIDNEGNVYTSWGRTPEAQAKIYRSYWFQKTLIEDGYMVWTLNHENYASPEKENLLTVSMLIKDPSLNKTIGVLIISQPISYYLSSILKTDSTAGSIGFIVDEEGGFLSEDNEYVQSIYEYIEPMLSKKVDTFSLDIDGEKAIVSTYTISLTQWQVIQVVPHKSIFEEVSRIRNAVFLILIVSMSLFTIIIIVFSSMLTRPLRHLRQIMKRVETGDLNESFEIKTRDEVGLLGKSFNKMLRRLRMQINNEIILERKKEQFKLEALQAQINPHFLHNTLNTLKWMSIMAGTKNITDMLLSLGHLLNMSIHRGHELITLQEEMDNVRSFLTIQKYRFGETIKITEHIAPETLPCYVPKLSLQPLVENVYQHASFMEEGAEMQIHSRLDENDNVYLEVIDNGLSFSQDKITEIHKHLNDETNTKFSGIGLSNVHKRVQMMFGEDYGLSIQRDDEKDLTYISIKLPYRRHR